MPRPPMLSASQVKDALEATASMANTPNDDVGFGLLDILAAIILQQPPCPGDCQAAPQSGGVDVPDLLALLGAWGGPQTPGTTCDLVVDGFINVRSAGAAGQLGAVPVGRNAVQIGPKSFC